MRLAGVSGKAIRMAVPAILVVGFALRYYATTTVPLTWHECHVVGGAERISLKPGAVNLLYHGGSRHPPGQMYLARLGTCLLGFNIAGLRFMSVVLGTAACWIIFALVRRAWGIYPAVLSLVLLTFNGYHIGVSSDAAERTYLFFTALAMYLFWRGLEEDRPWLVIAAGAITGVGGWVSENSYFLLPVLAVYVALSGKHRWWLKRWQTYAGVLLAAALFVPYLYWNIRTPSEIGTLAEDYSFYRERIGHLGLSHAALALYIAPLYNRFSGWISVEPVMSLVSGGILLAAVLYATFRWRDEFSKMLLVIFWVFFLVFSLLTSEGAEFRWAAPSLFAAVPLAGRALYELVTRSRICAVLAPLPLAYVVGFAIWTANVSVNCYYSPLIPPTPVQVGGVQLIQGLLTGAAVHIDFPPLVGSPIFPARYRTYYLDQYLWVAELADTGWMNPVLMGPAVARAARIDPTHAELPRLMKALERREAAQRQTGRMPSWDGPVFLRSPLPLLGLPEGEAQRQLAGMNFKFTWAGSMDPGLERVLGGP